MIASTKLAKAQRAMQARKEFWSLDLLTRVLISGMCCCSIVFSLLKQGTLLMSHPDKLFTVIFSDKGLCAGIHSSVSKATRRNARDSLLAGASANNATVVTVDAYSDHGHW